MIPVIRRLCFALLGVLILGNPLLIQELVFGNPFLIQELGTQVVNTVVAFTTIRNFTGDDQPATSNELSRPTEVDLDDVGNVYYTDTSPDRVGKVSDAQSNAGNTGVYLPIWLK